MSIQSYNHRDTPLRRFNTFWWGLAYFGLFGLVSVVVVSWTSKSPSAAELIAEERQEIIDRVNVKQAEILASKVVDSEKTAAALKKSPSASAVPLPTAVVADIGDPVKGKELYKSKTCFTCHGADGNSPIAPMFPKLGGKEAAYLSKKMKDIKSGAYTTALTPQMMPFIAQVSDEEIDHISAWLAGGSK